MSYPSGIEFWPLSPEADDIDLNDVVNAMGHIARWGGHTPYHYSLLRHSVCVAYRVSELGGTTQECLTGLLHDSPEAYVGDMTRPLKHTKVMAGYREAEERIAAIMIPMFGGIYPLPPIVKRADREVAKAEAVLLFGCIPEWWTSEWKALEDITMPVFGIGGNNVNAWKRMFWGYFERFSD